jgi:multidrug efflux pump subunit AcrA (membrane-fusion protein)
MKVTAAVLLALCMNSSALALDEPMKPASVVVSKIVQKEIFDTLSYPARVNPKINTTLLSESDGVVTSILAPLGKKVSRGQTILTITHTDPVYQYAPVRVVSPVNGVVSGLDVSRGSQVAHGQKVGTVTDPKQLKLLVEVPAQDLPMMQEGMVGEFKIPGNETPLSVKVRGISPAVDPGTGTAACEVEILPAQNLPTVIQGLVGQVSFKTQVRLGILLPDHVVNYKGKDPYVRAVENGKTKRYFVKLGTKQRGEVEILSGLPQESVVIQRTSRFVAEGEDVVVQDGQEGAEAKK